MARDTTNRCAILSNTSGAPDFDQLRDHSEHDGLQHAQRKAYLVCTSSGNHIDRPFQVVGFAFFDRDVTPRNTLCERLMSFDWVKMSAENIQMACRSYLFLYNVQY
jgi:hypothetical protein